MAQRVDEQIGVLAAIKPERHFVQVSLKVLRADLVPRPDDAAFEQRERRFHGVRVDIPAHVFFCFMIDGLVLSPVDSSFDHGRRVTCQFISDDHFYIGADVFLDVLRQRAGLRILSMKEPQIAAALPDADYNFLLILAVAYALALLLSAYVGFIYLNRARQFRLLQFGHCCSDAVAQIPCRLIAPADDAADLVSAHPLPGLAKQVRCDEPFCERKMCILKDGARDHRKLMLTGVALVAVVTLKQRMALVLATWAGDSVRPAQTFENFAATVISPKHFMQFDNRHRSTSGKR